MPHTYEQVGETARAWAKDPGLPRQLVVLASTLAESALPLSRDIFPDERTLAAFVRFGCHVCRRLDHAICGGIMAPPSEAGCPLGFADLPGDVFAGGTTGATPAIKATWVEQDLSTDSVDNPGPPLDFSL